MIKLFWNPETLIKKGHFCSIDGVWWAASNGVWTNLLAFKRSEIIEKQCVKNVTALRLDKQTYSFVVVYLLFKHNNLTQKCLRSFSSINLLTSTVFVKHDLKGVLKCIRVEICTYHPAPPPTTDVTDILIGI
jgi:hypothetical protein